MTIRAPFVHYAKEFCTFQIIKTVYAQLLATINIIAITVLCCGKCKSKAEIAVAAVGKCYIF